MNWLKKWIEAAKNPDKFWEDFHRDRREKSLAHYRREAQIAYGRYTSAVRMIAYFQAQLDAASNKEKT